MLQPSCPLPLHQLLRLEPNDTESSQLPKPGVHTCTRVHLGSGAETQVPASQPPQAHSLLGHHPCHKRGNKNHDQTCPNVPASHTPCPPVQWGKFPASSICKLDCAPPSPSLGLVQDSWHWVRGPPCCTQEALGADPSSVSRSPWLFLPCLCPGFHICNVCEHPGFEQSCP